MYTYVFFYGKELFKLLTARREHTSQYYTDIPITCQMYFYTGVTGIHQNYRREIVNLEISTFKNNFFII